MKTKRILTALLLAATFTTTAALAQSPGPAVPALINYQGYVTDAAGAGLYPAGANAEVKFRLYTAMTGGAPVWEETQQVTIAAGNFSVLLGNGQAAVGSPTLDVLFGPNPPGSVAAGASLYLAIKVGTDLEISPRQQIVANPLALRAKHADTAQTVAAGGVNAAALASGSVMSAAIAGNAITNVQLADNAVTTAELADGSVTTAKLAAGAAAGNLGAASITNAMLANGAVTLAKMAADSVDGTKIVNSSIGTADINDGTLTGADVAGDTLGIGHINFASGANASTTIHTVTGGTSGTRLTVDTATVASAVEGTIRLFFAGSSKTPQMFMDTNGFFCIRQDGTLPYARLDSTGDWQISSDARLKKDIAPAEGMLDKAMHIQPVRFHWKDTSNGADLELGVIAQNVKEVVPELASRHVAEDGMLSVNYAGLSVVAIGAIQEQQANITAQDERVQALEKENAALKARLDRIEQSLAK